MIVLCHHVAKDSLRVRHTDTLVTATLSSQTMTAKVIVSCRSSKPLMLTSLPPIIISPTPFSHLPENTPVATLLLAACLRRGRILAFAYIKCTSVPEKSNPWIGINKSRHVVAAGRYKPTVSALSALAARHGAS